MLRQLKVRLMRESIASRKRTVRLVIQFEYVGPSSRERSTHHEGVTLLGIAMLLLRWVRTHLGLKPSTSLMLCDYSIGR